MPFDPSTITVGPIVEPDGEGIVVWWESATLPDGPFQLYVNRELTWWGNATQVFLPAPIERTLYQVGTVDPGEEATDFSDDLPQSQGTGDKALLSWIGGTWEEESPPGSGLAGFHVYGEATPGGGVNETTPVATVAAYTPGLETDGYGYGGYGEGGYGAASGLYWWKSGPLANGTWTYAVKAYDNAGNESLIQTSVVTISGPPEPPARDGDTGLRVSLTYDSGTGKATLNWNASPG